MREYFKEAYLWAVSKVSQTQAYNITQSKVNQAQTQILSAIRNTQSKVTQSQAFISNVIEKTHIPDSYSFHVMRVLKYHGSQMIDGMGAIVPHKGINPNTAPAFNDAFSAIFLFDAIRGLGPYVIHASIKQIMRESVPSFKNSRAEVMLASFGTFYLLLTMDGIRRSITRKLADAALAKTIAQNNPQENIIHSCTHSQGPQKEHHQNDLLEVPKTVNTSPIVADLEGIGAYLIIKKFFIPAISEILPLGEYYAPLLDMINDGGFLVEGRVAGQCADHRYQLLAKNLGYNFGVGLSLKLTSLAFSHLFSVLQHKDVDDSFDGILFQMLMSIWMLAVLQSNEPLGEQYGCDIFYDMRLFAQSIMRRFINTAAFLYAFMWRDFAKNEAEVKNIIKKADDASLAEESFADIPKDEFVAAIKKAGSAADLNNNVIQSYNPDYKPAVVVDEKEKSKLAWLELQRKIINFSLFEDTRFAIYPVKFVMDRFLDEHPFDVLLNKSQQYNSFYEYAKLFMETETMKLFLKVYGDSIESGLNMAINWREWPYTQHIKSVLKRTPNWLLISADVADKKKLAVTALNILFAKGVDNFIRELSAFLHEVQRVSRSQNQLIANIGVEAHTKLLTVEQGPVNVEPAPKVYLQRKVKEDNGWELVPGAEPSRVGLHKQSKNLSNPPPAVIQKSHRPN